MKKCTIALALVVTFISCGKSKNQPLEDGDDNSIPQDYYQKSLRYDGFKGTIDSVVSNVYEAEGLSRGELVSSDIKRYNVDGYIISHETKAFEGDELQSAGQTIYGRTSNSLENEQTNNYITKTGAGYTLQYSLVERNSNKETWELLRKIPGRNIELMAEVREYSKNGLHIYTQVGSTDSVALRYEYKYLDNGLDTAILFYDQGVVRQSINKSYNENGNPTTLTTKYIGLLGDVNYEKIETYEYNYDEQGNPIQIKIFDENILMGIIENQIFYTKTK